jgi:uncharacterized protein (TIGR02599 family)
MKTSPRTAAFTLVEVLVAASVVVVLMGVLLSMTDQTQRLMKSTSGKVEQFQESRVAFESMTRRLSQATLNTYWDYEYDRNAIPTRYQRTAELRFVSGPAETLLGGSGPAGQGRPGHAVFFHAPNGLVENQVKYGVLDNLINVWGYFLEVGTDKDTIPTFLQADIPEKRRFRLMEFMQPSEQLKTYEFQMPGVKDWFAPIINNNIRPVRVLANNVIGLFILPRLSRADEDLWKLQKGTKNIPLLAPKYAYDTTKATVSDPILNPRNQLPPVVQVVMVAIDEVSAARLQDRAESDTLLGIDYGARFQNPANLEDNPSTPKAADGDLSLLEELLAQKRVAYRIFATNVSIRGAKWSRSQAN